MIERRSKAALAVLLGAWLAAGPALAQPSVRDPARAEALFQEGKALFEEGQYAEACKRLERSDALDPAPSTMGLLAGCLERTGRLASAWKAYITAAKRDDASNPERAAFARAQAAALEPRLPKLTIRLAQPLPGTEVFLNGSLLPAEDLGAELPVDPGPQAILVRAPSRKAFSKTVEAREASRQVVEVPELEHAAPASTPPRPSPPETSGAPGAPDSPDASGGGSSLVPAALIAGGVGLVGLGVGTAFGLSALDKQSESEQRFAQCDQIPRNEGACAESEARWNDSRDAANWATLGFGVGALGVGVAAVLLVVSSGSGSRPEPNTSRSLRVSPVTLPRGGGVLLERRF